jgi:hypothetical protein
LTVTSHLKHIYKKFGLHNRTAVVAKVLTEGIACGFSTAWTGRLPIPLAGAGLSLKTARKKLITN